MKHKRGRQFKLGNASATPAAGHRSFLVDALRQIAAPDQVLKLAAVALGRGCSPQQAYILGSALNWMVLAGLDWDEVGEDFQDPTHRQWRAALGKGFDFAAAEAAFDSFKS